MKKQVRDDHPDEFGLSACQDPCHFIFMIIQFFQGIGDDLLLNIARRLFVAVELDLMTEISAPEISGVQRRAGGVVYFAMSAKVTFCFRAIIVASCILFYRNNESKPYK